jgi:hypothetical protein
LKKKAKLFEAMASAGGGEWKKYYTHATSLAQIKRNIRYQVNKKYKRAPETFVKIDEESIKEVL